MILTSEEARFIRDITGDILKEAPPELTEDGRKTKHFLQELHRKAEHFAEAEDEDELEDRDSRSAEGSEHSRLRFAPSSYLN